MHCFVPSLYLRIEEKLRLWVRMAWCTTGQIDNCNPASAITVMDDNAPHYNQTDHVFAYG